MTLITKPEFVQSCINAYILHHGYSPSRPHIQEWMQLYEIFKGELKNGESRDQ